MLNALQALLAPAVMERLALLANHVLISEPVAAQRLRAHIGRCVVVRLEGWPALLPAPPTLAFRITPAALLEWCGADAPADAELRVTIDASNPALALLRSLAGERPKVEVTGDAAFATDVSWLFDNLRWDIEDDLARVVGQAPAHELARIVAGVADGLRRFAQSLAMFARRAGGGDADAGQPAR
jgi:ubiquinone biosynthesis accessory factor UbiJ